MEICSGNKWQDMTQRTAYWLSYNFNIQSTIKVPSWVSLRIQATQDLVFVRVLSFQTPFITSCTPRSLPKLRTELVPRPQPYHPRLVHLQDRWSKYPPVIMWAFTLQEGKSFTWDWSCYPYEGLLGAHRLSWKAKSMLYPKSLGYFFLDSCVHLVHSKLHFPTLPLLYPWILSIHTKWPEI